MPRLLAVMGLLLGSLASLRTGSGHASALVQSGATCPVTQTSPATTPPSSIDPSIRPAGANWLWYGNAYIWTQLPPGSTAAIHRGAALKVPWWRIVSGRLAISGHRVGAQRPRLTARIPNGYGDIDFQSTGITFPKLGCWRVTGHLGGHTLSFVLKIMRSGS